MTDHVKTDKKSRQKIFMQKDKRIEEMEMALSSGSDTILVYSTSWCSDCRRTKHLLNEYGIGYTEIDVDQDEAGLAFVKETNHGHRVVPTMVFPDGTILVEPSNSVLATKLGLILER